MINTDYLAEMHYANCDPQYMIDNDEQEELENDTCKMIEGFINTAIDSSITLGEEKGMNIKDFIKNNKDYLCDYFYELLESYGE